MKNKKLAFFSTNAVEDFPNGLYGYSAYKHLSKKLNKKIKFITKVDINHNKKIDFIVCIPKTILVFSKIFFFHKLSELKYKDINIGIYILSKALRSKYSYKKNLILYLRYFYFLNSFFKYYRQLQKVKKNYEIIGCYMHEGVYLDGAVLNFLNNSYYLYSNQYPRNFNYIKVTTPFEWSLVRKIYPLKIKNTKSLENKIDKTKNIINKMLNTNDNSHYAKGSMLLESSNDENLYSNLSKDYDYILYLHAFTDAFYGYGKTDFESIYEWTEFTLNKLIDKNVIIKAHPNFYNKGIIKINERMTWDLKAYEYLEKKYSKNKNFKFINKPINNIKLLKHLNKKCIAITKHGNALIEAIISGKKAICSSETYWKDFKICSNWSSKKEYSNLLKKKYIELPFPEKRSLDIFLTSLYFQKYSDRYKDQHNVLVKMSNIDEKLFRYNLKDKTLRKKITLTNKVIDKFISDITLVN